MLLPFLLEEVRCIPDNIFCELYVVKVWEVKLGMLLGFCVPFLVVLHHQYCMLEDSPTQCQMHDIYICVSSTMARILLGGIL